VFVVANLVLDAAVAAVKALMVVRRSSFAFLVKERAFLIKERVAPRITESLL
jgi:hypothetical protein